MLPYKIHQFDGKEFELSKTIPAYTKYCGYDYCMQEYNNQTFPIPVQNIFQFSEPAYLKDGYYRRYSKKFDLERTRNYRYFKNGEVYIQDSYSYVFEWGLSEYTRGFLEGYNENFTPVINTEQAHVEMIVKAAMVRPEFVNIKTDNNRVVKMHCVYSQGLKEGKRYKAWGIIEQTPNVFVNYFIDTTKTDQPASPKPFAGLLRELSDTQLNELFTLLTTINNGYSKLTFIDREITDLDSFNHIFGGKDIQNPVIPIEWKANKQFLIDLLAGLQKEVMYNKKSPNTRQLSNEIVRQTKLYFIDSKTKQILKLPKNNNRLKNRPEYTRIANFLATL